MSVKTGHIHISRTIKVGQERLWHLLTDPEMRTLWGAPSDEHVLDMVSHDLREGGRDLHRCGPADNPEFEVATHWYHLAGPDMACFTETLEIGGARLSVSLVGYGLETVPGGTKLDVDISVTSLTGDDLTPDHEEGWLSGLNRLVAMAEKETANA